MRPLRPDEIVDLESYAGVRDAYRRVVIAYKSARRMAVGEMVTLLFEDRETLRFQVQEMLWVERLAEPEAVQHELDVYNELMPGERELSATLFVEIEDPGRIRAELDRLVGIDEHVALRLAAGGDERRIAARFDPKQREEDRISAVQYIRFALDDTDLRLLADPRVPAAIAIDHPRYAREAPLPGALRQRLCAGLAADPEPLLARLAAAPADAPLFEVGALRVLARRGNPTDLRIVARDRAAARRWLEGDASFGADLEEALRRAARHVIERAGSARIEARAGRDADAPAWRVTAGDGR